MPNGSFTCRLRHPIDNRNAEFPILPFFQDISPLKIHLELLESWRRGKMRRAAAGTLERSGTRRGHQASSRRLRRRVATGVDSDVAVPTVRNDKREAKNRRQKVVAGRTRHTGNGGDERGARERKKFGRRVATRVGADREKSIPVREGRSQVERESGGERVRLPFWGARGRK